MTDNFIRIWYLSRKLIHKYESLQKEGKPLETQWQQFYNIFYNSIPVVYPNWNELDNEMLKAHKARKARKNRIKKYIKGMFDSYEPQKLFFLTITFSDDAFKASATSRHRYITRYLNSNCLDYMANLDYGTKKKREHYHAVIAADNDFLSSIPPNSHVHYKRITSRNPSRIAKYLSKLTNHAQKLTCGKPFHKRGFVEVDALPF